MHHVLTGLIHRTVNATRDWKMLKKLTLSVLTSVFLLEITSGDPMLNNAATGRTPVEKRVFPVYMNSAVDGTYSPREAPSLAFIDTGGNRVSQESYVVAQYTGKGWVVGKEIDGRLLYGMVNEEGKIVLECRMLEIVPFEEFSSLTACRGIWHSVQEPNQERTSPVEQPGWGVLRNDGCLVAACIFDRCEPVPGLDCYALESNGKVGWVLKDGTGAPAVYDSVFFNDAGTNARVTATAGASLLMGIVHINGTAILPRRFLAMPTLL